MAKNKIFSIGSGECRVEDLKRALSTCNSNSRLKISLCVNEPAKEDERVSRLKDLCSDMYTLLDAASICVDICAKDEKKSDFKSIYYEGEKGFNCGSVQLAEDIRAFMKDYHEERVQIDLIG